MSNTKQPRTAPDPGTGQGKNGKGPAASKSALKPRPISKSAAKIEQRTAKAPRRETKQEQVLKMLRSESGATVPAIMQATGWQKHSVHGFFSAVVRKKLGLALTAEGKGDARVYRLAPESGQEKGGEG